MFESCIFTLVFRWHYKDTVLNIADQFTYLDITFNYTDTCKVACSTGVKRCSFIICSIFVCFNEYIFDRMVVPVLLHDSEVCSIENVSDVEKIKIKSSKFIKLCLLPRQQLQIIISSLSSEGYLSPLYYEKRIFMYWFIHNKDSLTYKIYRLLICKYCYLCKNWAVYVKSLLQELVYLNLW